jgi:3-phenylpropionate/trans-cinnamate dioxygenase ferredoxin reductase subunit
MGAEPAATEPRDVDVLVIGAGAAGAACAEALAEAGFAGSVLLAGRDLDPPYERPLCSKGYLRGGVGREATYLRPAAWWAEHGVELLTRTSVMKLDTAARVATLSGGPAVRYGHAVLATGSNVRRLRVDGAELEGIHYLRALGNADSIRGDVEDAAEVVLVGGSYIACEVAASLTANGKRCTLVMQEELPLSRGFGDTAGRFFGDLLREHGVEWAGGETLERFEGSGGRVERVVTASGREFAADAVVMGTGAVPDVMLARAAGLELGTTGGIACSASLETSAPGVWAAGDACEYEAGGGRSRIEHWEVARAQGRAVAAAIMGDARPFAEVPYFWSDLADWCTLEWVGHARPWDREVLRGSLDDGAFSLSYLAGDRLVAALAVGRPDDLEEARRELAAS